MSAWFAAAVLLLGADPQAEVTPPELLGGPLALGQLPDRPDRPTRVVVWVTIDAEGAPGEVEVVTSAGVDVDAVVVEAIRRARFRPAVLGGEPLAVRIQWPIDLPPPEPEPEPEPEPGAAVTGEVLERGTRRPLAGQPVLVEGTDLETLTDAEGRFAIQGLRIGREVTLVVPSYDYLEARVVVVPPASDLVVRLEARPDRRYRSVVTAPSGDAARLLIPMEQAREVPGTSGDPLKVIEVLPGVARPPAAGPASGQIAIRGSAPEDTKYYIDGLPLFQLFHFGSIYSVLQDEWIRDIDYRPGGFSAEYGDATGGLLGVRLAALPDDGVHGHVDVNVYHAAALLTAPIGEHWTVGAALRRSYVDAILGAVLPEDSGVSFGTAPRYWDYQVRADYRDERSNLRLLWFGSDDELSVLQSAPSDDDPSSSGFSLRRFFHQLQAVWDYQLTDRLTLTLRGAASYQGLRIAPGASSFDLTFDPGTLRADLDWRPSERLRFRGGVEGTATRYRIDARLPPPTKEGQVPIPLSAREPIVATEEGVSGRMAAWAEVQWRPLPEFSLNAGARVTGWLGDFEAWAIDPRLTLTWDVTETTRLTLASGLNHQAPAPDEASRSFGSTDLRPERAAYVQGGVRQQIGDYLSLDVQGFYKHMDELVSLTGDFSGGVPYDNAGEGFAAGGELLARLDSRWVDGWISYTLSRSMRRDRPGQPLRPFSFDQTHILSLVAGVNPGLGFRIAARFRYATGNPYTPLTTGYYDATADVYVPAPAAAPLSGRTADFLQLDLRVDKEFVFDDWQLDVYLELQNATNRANTEAVGYNFDYSAREDITGLPILPSLGIRGSF